MVKVDGMGQEGASVVEAAVKGGAGEAKPKKIRLKPASWLKRRSSENITKKSLFWSLPNFYYSADFQYSFFTRFL